ncbi:MAG: NAD-dependent epimerase/dehydratase family protein [Magnetococcales bacterium]|nr:NAD-dependent epimerase/dehydratase family protein [Magnetococcales bacterium]
MKNTFKQPGLYLITGGYGFIGSHLADALLARGHRVRILDDLSTGHVENVRGPHEFIRGDVGDATAVNQAMAGVNGCFHLAAVASVQRSNEDWAGTHRANQTGSVLVFNAARQTPPVPVVYASSAAVFGDNPNVPLVEWEPIQPLTAYGADKAGSELHGRVAARVHGVPNVGLRFFNVYGPRQDPSSPYSGVISIFVDRILAGRPLTIFGDGEQTRDFVYVADVVAHLLAAMERATEPHARIFNVCTNQATSINQLAHTLFELAGRRVDVVHQPPRSGDIRTSVGNPQRAVRELGVSARVVFRDGLRLLLDSQL